MQKNFFFISCKKKGTLKIDKMLSNMFRCIIRMKCYTSLIV